MTVFKLDSCYAKDAFIICNSQGRSKGMAIVTFQRLGDAAAAKAKYDGKFIDMSKEFAISWSSLADEEIVMLILLFTRTAN